MDLRVPSAELPTIDTMMKKYNFTFTESKKYIFYAGAELFKRNPEEFFLFLKAVFPDIKSE